MSFIDAADSTAQAMDRRSVVLLAVGHFTDDINQSFLPALLPLLVAAQHLSYAVAATLVLAQGISSSVVQPVIGYIADKRPLPWIAGLGLVFAGGGIAAIGFMPSYPLLFLCALLSGLGVAMWHPEAARFTNLASGLKKASGMRWFAVGGNIGFAVGPAFATLAIYLAGIRGTWLAAIPVLILATLILRDPPRLYALWPKTAAVKAATQFPDDWAAFGRLTVFAAVRSMSYIGLISFTPLYFVHVVQTSPGIANMVLTAFLLAGVAGTLIGAPFADRYGRLIVIWTSNGGSVCFALLLALFVTTPGPISLALGFVLAALLGALITSGAAALIVLGQEYLPNRMGTASGVTLGLAVSVGGIFSPILGMIGDRWGLHATLLAIVALLTVSFLLGFWMPATAARREKLLALRTV
jgi:FSR family fosmidomycin resistance protein-like MFS transporter